MKLAGKTQSRLHSISSQIGRAPMTSKKAGNLHETLGQTRYRESRAALNFAPPELERLNETYTRPRRTYHPSDFNQKQDKLCSNCSGIKFSALFDEGLKNDVSNEIPIRKPIPIGYSDEVYARATCPFCRLLVDIGDTNVSGDERAVEFWWIITVKGHEVLSTIAEPLYEIRDEKDGPRNSQNEAIYLALVKTVQAPPMYGFEYRTIFKDMTYIGLVKTNEVVTSRSLALRSTANAEEITGRLRNWVLRCNGHKSCQARTTNWTAYPDGFSLFDISALQVVNSFEHGQYIALSYPWSQIDEFEIKRDRPYIFEELPKALQDVIGFIKELQLGINFIWMDKLCINLDDPVEKTANINAMGEIYGAAFATIILAVPSRESLEPGIPGFSGPRPPYQRVETVGNMKLATTYPSLEMAIATSKWNSRAWTFQEGLLSNRCILFGPEQSYFECAEMGCCESIKEPALALSEQDYLIPYKSRLRNPFMDTVEFNSLYWRLVHDYTGRDMSFASDSLHAFSAFTRQFERAGHSLTWGLPISSSPLHLLWEREPWDFRGISRRKEFPSWSWAGWCGTAAMNFPLDTGSEMDYSCTVAEESPCGRILDCNVRCAKVNLSGQSPLFSIAEAPGSSMMLDYGMSVAPELYTCDYMIVEVCRTNSYIHGLLVKQNNGVYERIGSGFMKLSDFEAARPDHQKLKLA